MSDTTPVITVFVCPGGCRCNCASGTRDCDHIWDGPTVPVGENGESASCSRCGMPAMDHDMAVLP